MKRIQIITGHYGSGKTEFAVNLALHLAETDPNVALADLDKNGIVDALDALQILKIAVGKA